MAHYRMRVKAVWDLLKAAATGWARHNSAWLGAALSDYTIFALPRLFVIVIFIASLWLEESNVRSELFGQLGGLIGTKGADAIESALQTPDPHKQGLLASTIAIGALIL